MSREASSRPHRLETRVPPPVVARNAAMALGFLQQIDRWLEAEGLDPADLRSE